MGTDFRVEFFKNTTGITTKTTTKTATKILDEILKNPRISMDELAKVCNLTKDGIKYHLNKMKKNNVIKRIGPVNGGTWEIVKKEEI